MTLTGPGPSHNRRITLELTEEQAEQVLRALASRRGSLNRSADPNDAQRRQLAICVEVYSLVAQALSMKDEEL